MVETKEQIIIESMSPIERTIFPQLTNKSQSANQIAEKTETDQTTVMRAIEFLKAKELVETQSKETKMIEVGLNGLLYLKKQLPERRLLIELEKLKSIPITEIAKICNLNENEAKIAIGVLKRKAVIEIKSGRVLMTAETKEITKKMLEELLLEKIPIEIDKLEPQEKLAFENLKQRKNILEVNDRKQIYAKLTELGEKISSLDLNQNLIEQLTPKMIKSSSWKGKKFRRYNILSPIPRIDGGKKHFVNQATEYAKSIWLEMGFKEMTGPITITGFWNFDILFTPQDHPVREIQDTFFIKDIEGKLPDKHLVQAVKKSHEVGVDKSKGWQCEWKEKNAKKVLLRTHTTCLSAQTLIGIAKNKEFPAKYFALGKCFRNETVDWSHGFEFNQTEGIVVDENANFRQLLGYLVEFFKKMGYEKIRIRPGYFPYTEPSLEIDAFHPEKKKWVELGGAGLFRPELTIPIFGKHIPVLAWGPGFDRIIMEYYKIKDLREMYKNNITKLRDMKIWKK